MSQNYYREEFEPKVGDLVRIRTYEDMKSEFGARENGIINCAFSFIPAMRQLEGIEFEITNVEPISYDRSQTLKIYGLPKEYDGWKISVDMIEPVDDCSDEGFDSTEIESFLADIKIT